MPPLHPVQALFCAFQRNQAEALGEHFVGNDRGVVIDVDLFDGEGGYFGKEDAAEGVSV